MDLYQKTIAGSFSIEGKGLFGGKEVHLIFLPAEDDQGIRFVRTDLSPTVEIPAIWSNVVNTDRTTVLEKNSAQVSTVEHCLSALWSFGITNVTIQIDADELPILDGSAAGFTKLLRKTGSVKQKSKAKILVIDKAVELNSRNRSIAIRPNSSLRIQYSFNYRNSIQETFDFDGNEADYDSQIAPARTFCLSNEFEFFSSHCKGLSKETGFIIRDSPVADQSIKRFFCIPELKDVTYSSHYETIGSEPPRFPEEVTRHKILDMIGDFALSQKLILGHVTANGSGHTENLDLLRKILG